MKKKGVKDERRKRRKFITPNIKEKDKKEYKLDDFLDITVVAHKNSCYFCKNMSDIIYDYTNGPYGICCEKECYNKEAMYGKCKHFKEEGE